MKWFYGFLSFGTGLLLASCAPRSAYIPVTHNLPQFDTLQQLHTAAYISANHIEVQASGNPFRHVATAVNLNFGSGIAVYDLALGWYGYSRNCNWHYTVMAGIGYNSNLFFRDPNSRGWFTKTRNGYDILSLYNRYYLQPSLSFEDDFGYYDIRYGFSLSVRSSYLFFQRFRYQEIDADLTTDLNNPVYVVNRSYRGKDMWIFEPALTHTVRRGPLAVIVQLQSISPYSTEIDVNNTKFSPGLLLSTGIRYTLSGKHRSK